MNRVVAIYRSPAYSPHQHLENDRAILDAVVAHFPATGWHIIKVSEADVAAGQLPRGDLYLNMCQGPDAAARLQELLPRDVPCINTPSAVLACHRHRLVPLLRESGVPFPPTVLLSTTGAEAAAPPVHPVTENGHPVWVKRGDVHAQRTEDVVRVRPPELVAALGEFAARGIRRVALQAHVPGPVVKFYGVIGRAFFHWYAADTRNQAAVVAPSAPLQDLAERAAEALGLSVYGGDAVLTAPDAPMLIDLNDWPSFAPVRSSAAAAIAGYARQFIRKGRYSCSTP
jgi:glutathione synthase/RimK-type ligase-like ATP-grasp enzyme